MLGIFLNIGVVVCDYIASSSKWVGLQLRGEMKSRSVQMDSGKAFEYAILKEFEEKLKIYTTTKVIVNAALNTAKDCFEQFDKQEQGRYLITASFAVNFLKDVEPRLSNDVGKSDILELEIMSDSQGVVGDVRDVVVIRKVQSWEIGVSAKNNHQAVKHSRLSSDNDFGEKWVGIKCSKTYFNEIEPIFSSLKLMRKNSNHTKTWKSLGDHHSKVYMPVLAAFEKELKRIYKTNPTLIANRLVEYVVGRIDFYKVIKRKNSVEIQAYNLHGTLNLPFEDISPKFCTPQIELPDKILDISYKEDSKTTIIVTFNKDWKLSFRIHSASTRIEASLKFDINLLNAPTSLFEVTLKIPKVAQ